MRRMRYPEESPADMAGADAPEETAGELITPEELTPGEVDTAAEPVEATSAVVDAAQDDPDDEHPSTGERITEDEADAELEASTAQDVD